MTEFYGNGNIKFFGNIVDGKKSGVCKEFTKEGVLKYEGVMDDSNKVNGKLYSNKGSLIFEGEFKNNSPWNGVLYNQDINGIKEFTGEIKEGKPFEGNGFIFKWSSDSERYNEIINHEAMEEYEVYRRESEEDEYYDYEEHYQEQENEHIRSMSEVWDEYIKADWAEGNYKERENKESNKKVYGYPKY